MKEDEEIVNLAYLNGLLKGKKEQINQILNLFIEHTPPAIREIKMLIETKAWSDAQIKVHAIKSYYSYLGNKVIDQKICEWETQLAAGQTSCDHAAIVNDLEARTTLIVEKLKQIVSSERPE